MPLSLFRNHTFAVTSAVGFVVGFALFGAITYLPLYFQITKGSSPTRSGLELTPLMAGLLVTSIVSGQLISRFGRYKAFPVAGTAPDGRRHVAAHPARGGYGQRGRDALRGDRRPRPRDGDAGPRARGPELGPLRGDGRRDERLDVVPAGRRLDRRLALRGDLRGA